MYDIFFWEPTLSPHKLEWIARLQEDSRVRSCHYISDVPLHQERVNLGWTINDESDIEICVSPNDDKCEEIFQRYPDAIHVFSGIRHVPVIVKGLKLALRHRARFGICSEPRVIEGFSGKIRLIQSWLTESRIRRHAQFVLAIGANGPIWFLLAGYSKEVIHPFAYFVNPMIDGDQQFEEKARPEIGYIGRLVADKGVTNFINAAEQLRSYDKIIVGGGDLAGAVRDAAQRDSTLRFNGVLQRSRIHEVLHNLDVLVLPSQSTSDGWGVVVSEALLAGCFVIVSKMAGSSYCIIDPRIGTIVSKGSADEIARAVQDAMKDGYLKMSFRKLRRQWAIDNLSAKAGANQFLAILDSVVDGMNPAEWPMPI